MKKTKLGIYGGTFSPPHLGHVAAAEAFLEQMCLDKLLIIPTFIPPHKMSDGEATPQDRLDMCEIAFSHMDKVEISDMEIKRGGKSYTYLTLEELKDESREIYLLCGSDMILTFDTWNRPERIFELATVCYIRRERSVDIGKQIDEKCAKYRELYGARIHQVFNETTEISSTKVRNLVSLGMSVDGLLSPSVAEFVEKRGLYR